MRKKVELDSNEMKDAAKSLSRVPEPLLLWYEKKRRQLPWREIPTPYRVWVSEIMLQQTRVEAGKAYFERFIQELPDVKSLANVSDQQLMKLWEGLGYYSRANNLKKAAGVVMEQYGGTIPDSYEKLLQLPGVGPYTAGAVASIAFGIAAPAVDGNVLRVFSRILASEKDIADASTKREMEYLVLEVMPKERAGDFNQALMELGAVVCLPNGEPKCGECPVSELCQARKQGRCGELPVKKKKKDRRIEEKTVLVLLTPDGEKTALKRRPTKGLLAGLFELPNLEGALPPDAVERVLAEWKLTAAEIQPLGEAKHIFSHVEWQMTGYRILLDQKTVEKPEVFLRTDFASATEEQGYTWISQEELNDEYALPSAFRAYREKIW